MFSINYRAFRNELIFCFFTKRVALPSVVFSYIFISFSRFALYLYYTITTN